MDIPKYLGNECAELYWELWKNRRNYLSRRVDTHELLDSQATRQSITFDINGREIQELYSARFDTQSVESLELHSFPLVLLNKRPFFDVSLRGPSGALHPCRRMTDICISAHIIVGACLTRGQSFKPDQLSELFINSARYLGYDRGPHKDEKDTAKLALQNTIKDAQLGNDDELWNLLRQLDDHYIQCIEFDYRNTKATYIVKLDFTSQRVPAIEYKQQEQDIFEDTLAKKADSDPFTELSLFASSQLSDDIVELAHPRGDVVGKTCCSTDGDNKEVGIDFTRLFSILEIIARPFRSLGILAAYVRIPLLGADLPNHVRIIAANGTIIHGVSINDTQFETRRPTNNILVEHHRERASFVLRSLPSGVYDLYVRLDTKITEFILPAFVVALLQSVSMLVALYVGPSVVARNSVAFTGTTLITPFVSALFLARGAEHDLLSKILMFPRIILLSASISTIVTGTFLSVQQVKYFSSIFILLLIATAFAGWIYCYFHYLLPDLDDPWLTAL